MAASQSRGPQVTAVCALFLSLSCIAVALRCYVRLVMVKAFGVDDVFAVVALVFFALACCLSFGGVYYGVGRHLADLDPHQIRSAMRFNFYNEMIYIITPALIRISIGLYLARIAVKRSHLYTIYAAMSASVIMSTFVVFFFAFQCHPVSFFWTRFAGGTGHCMNANVIASAIYAQAAMSVIADWTLALIPALIVWNLQMNSRTKVSVALILGLGSLASTATIVRIPYIKDVNETQDLLFTIVDVGIWSIVEAGTGLIACSLATLKPLFRRFYNWNGSHGSGTHSRINDSSARKTRQSSNFSKTRMADDVIELRGGSKRGNVTTVIETLSKNGKSSLDGSSDGFGEGEWSTADRGLSVNSTENILAEPMPAWSGIRMTTKVESHSQAN